MSACSQQYTARDSASWHVPDEEHHPQLSSLAQLVHEVWRLQEAGTARARMELPLPVPMPTSMSTKDRAVFTL